MVNVKHVIRTVHMVIKIRFVYSTNTAENDVRIHVDKNKVLKILLKF